MNIDLTTGLLEPARHLFSPHHNERPPEASIDMIVVHNISLPPGQFGTGAIEQFFLGQLDFTAHPYYEGIAHLRVSAHLLINRVGEITQFVPFNKRAWHAGQSFFDGRTNCNDFSIGIELEGTDDTPFEAVQYQSLANVVSLIMNAYPGVTLERIVGHSDIAPGRKTDPGPFFEWSRLRNLLAANIF